MFGNNRNLLNYSPFLFFCNLLNTNIVDPMTIIKPLIDMFTHILESPPGKKYMMKENMNEGKRIFIVLMMIRIFF